MKNTVICIALLIVTTTVTAQINKNKPPKLHVVTAVDTDFNKQTYKPRIQNNRALSYEAWITTDGKLHCNTSLVLNAAEVKFVWPASSATAADGTSTSSGGDMSKKLTVTASEDLHYAFNIAKDGYKQAHKIILSLTANNGASATVTLINNKVEAIK